MPLAEAVSEGEKNGQHQICLEKESKVLKISADDMQKVVKSQGGVLLYHAIITEQRFAKVNGCSKRLRFFDMFPDNANTMSYALKGKQDALVVPGTGDHKGIKVRSETEYSIPAVGGNEPTKHDFHLLADSFGEKRDAMVYERRSWKLDGGTLEFDTILSHRPKDADAFEDVSIPTCLEIEADTAEEIAQIALQLGIGLRQLLAMTKRDLLKHYSVQE